MARIPNILLILVIIESPFLTEILSLAERTAFAATVETLMSATVWTALVATAFFGIALVVALPLIALIVASAVTTLFAFFFLQFVVVESEGADVAFFILLCLLKALLEVTVFLETMFLGHLALLLLSLHNATFRAEVLQFSVEHLVCRVES